MQAQERVRYAASGPLILKNAPPFGHEMLGTASSVLPPLRPALEAVHRSDTGRPEAPVARRRMARMPTSARWCRSWAPPNAGRRRMDFHRRQSAQHPPSRGVWRCLVGRPVRLRLSGRRPAPPPADPPLESVHAQGRRQILVATAERIRFGASTIRASLRSAAAPRCGSTDPIVPGSRLLKRASFNSDGTSPSGLAFLDVLQPVSMPGEARRGEERLHPGRGAPWWPKNAIKCASVSATGH